VHPLPADQGDKILGRRQGAGFAFGEDAFRERPLFVVQADDAFLDSALGDQAIYGDRPQLPDAVCSAHGLVFGSRVPPRVGDDHIVGSGQVEAKTTGFEADQKEVAVATLERRDAAAALGGGRGAVQVLVTDACRVKGFAQDLQEVDKLTEHQRLVAVGDQFAREIGKSLHLGAGDGELRAAQTRVASGAAQSRQLREDVEVRLRFRRTLQCGVDCARGFAAQGFIVRGFGSFRRDRQDQFGARRQFLQHFSLGPSQYEGTDQAFEDVLRLAVAATLDGPGEAFVEAIDGAQQARIGKAHDRPQVAKPVFHRRPGQRQTKIGGEFEHRLRALGGGVLDRLRFIDDEGVPGTAGEALLRQLQ
jgi:hypothetical protein